MLEYVSKEGPARCIPYAQKRKKTLLILTEYNGAGPNCSDDSLPVSLDPRSSDMSSAVERFKQFPMASTVAACCCFRILPLLVVFLLLFLYNIWPKCQA